ncbi:MAG: PqqD family protein [Kiritimatiellae bacterium]|nr:PqqD family protein [Kiritimatiellia bacterium]
MYRKKESLLSRQIAGETIVVPIRGKLADMQRIFALNSVAEHIWDRIDGRRDTDEIRRGIVERFEIDEVQARRDLDEFVRQLLDAGLVEEV